jgi:hypothetical protein
VFAFLSGLVRILLALFVVRLLFRAIAGLVRRGERSRPEPPPRKPVEAGELVRDAVCNTFVPKERALQAAIGGEPAYFCSTACRDRALAEAGGRAARAS